MKHFTIRACLALAMSFYGFGYSIAQDSDGLTTKPDVDHSYKPLKLNLDESGKKYVRFLFWHQQWLVTDNLEEDDRAQITSFARRSRILAYAQISPKFLILTHFGLNNFGPRNQTSLGNNGDGPQFFLHAAWTEFKVSRNEALHVGTGLHYWKGLTRLANASTLNFMTLDQARPFTHWHSLGVTDQFARHFGIYAKGQIGQFDYRLAINNPLNPANALGAGLNYGFTTNPDTGQPVPRFPNAEASSITYNGRNEINQDGDPTGNTIIEGYFRYNVFDKESTKLPYQVGTYFGKKKILGIGGGFFSHANGTYDNATNDHENVFHVAGDVFYDAPAPGGGINAYASFISFNYGDNYVSRWAGTGTNFYAQAGYFLADFKVMPYIAYQSGSYEALEDNVTSFDVGVNYYVNGHNAKITLEYHTIRGDYRDSPGTDGDVTQWRLQTHIFL